jgi:DNA polymerase-3 subunit delta'
VRLSRILGQSHAVGLLTEAAASGRPGSAYLLYGPPGTGKRTAAIAFAAALNCQEPPVPGDACETCRHCVAIAKGVLPEVRMMEPEEDTGRARSFHVETISEAIRWASRTTHPGRVKVGILEDTHLMSFEAANHFLKTLEEPPPRTVWVLLAPDRTAILPTLRSRCLPVRFTLLSREAIEAIFRSQGRAEDDRPPGESSPSADAAALCLGRLDVPLEEIREAIQLAESFLSRAEAADLGALAESAQAFGRKEEAVRIPLLLDGLERVCAARLRGAPGAPERWIAALDAVARAQWRWRQNMGKTLVDALGAELVLALSPASGVR